MKQLLVAEAQDAHGELTVNLDHVAAAENTPLRTDLARSRKWAPERDDLPDRQVEQLAQG
jgi:hypothetical protein